MQPANIMRKQDVPLQYPRTVGVTAEDMKTSFRAGKVQPAYIAHLMPEDRPSGTVQIAIRQEEMAKIIGNAVHVRAHAYFVSYAALARFDGSMDAVSRAWGQRDGSVSLTDLAPYSDALHGEFFEAWGEHAKTGESINQDFMRAYNVVVNYRRQQVSKSLPLRDEDDFSLARSLWGDTAIARVVPDFDAAMLEQSIPLTWTGDNLTVSGSAPISNLYMSKTAASQGTSAVGPVTGGSGTAVGLADEMRYLMTGSTTDNNAASDPDMTPLIDDFSAVVAEMAGVTGSISLAQVKNSERIKQMAERRRNMAGLDEDMIEVLMRGFSIPSALYNDPIALDVKKTVINQSQRYATDYANITEYVADGGATLTLNLAGPKQTTGGFIVVTYEAVPEPVFDRMANLPLRQGFSDWPNAQEDMLDTQPVEVVQNRFVDALHTTEDGTFGYAPLNYARVQRRIKMGGRFYRELSDNNTDEDQLHIWSVRVTDPVLDEDTFLVPQDLDHYVFEDTTVDPFFARITSVLQYEGITQFGPMLYESTGDFDAVASVVPGTDIIPPSEA